MDAARFLITCPARTGSTMLVRYLRSHPDVYSHGEVLAPDRPVPLYGLDYDRNPALEQAIRRQRDRDPVAFLREFVWVPGERRAVGFKGKYEELLLSQYAPVLQEIRRDTVIRVLHLTRENLLERYLSQYLAVNIYGAYNAPVEDGLRVRLSPEECDQDFRRTEERQRSFREMLRNHDVLELTYEQLVRDRRAALAKVQAFLGLEERELTSPTTKLLTRPAWEVIENFEDLARHFRSTPYEAFFDTDASSESG